MRCRVGRWHFRKTWTHRAFEGYTNFLVGPEVQYLPYVPDTLEILTMPGLLICDDNPNIRYLLRAFVESRTPFNVCGEAAHGVEAIEKAKKLQPDLILLDCACPL
jgi:hypothetical protein